jgi:hypothetical protein
MNWTTLENTPITIDLLVQGNSRGWYVEGGYAIHETCNAGFISKVNYPIVIGVEYEISYSLVYVNTGNVRARIGGVDGVARTTAGFYTEMITATSTDPLEFYSNANAKLSPVTIRQVTNVINPKDTSTIVWSEIDNKWSDWRLYNPDCGFSLFANLFMYKLGQAWVSSPDAPRNRFFGTQFNSIVQFTANAYNGVPKTFESISYEANRLLITTTDGITTSLGQVSELVGQDFLKTILDDGVTQVNVYDSEGIYSAGFMRDKNTDIINGDPLKGTFIVIELITTDTGVLKLRNVMVNSIQSKIGAR